MSIEVKKDVDARISEAEDLCKFVFFMKHRDWSAKEICGKEIESTITINGETIVVSTTIDYCDIARYNKSMAKIINCL